MNTWAGAGRLGCGRSGRRLPLRFAPHGNGRRDHASLSGRRLQSHGEGAIRAAELTQPLESGPGVDQPRPVFRGRRPGNLNLRHRRLPSGREVAERPQGPRPVVRRHHPLPHPLRDARRNAGHHGSNRRNHHRPRWLATHLLTGKSPNQGRLNPCKFNTTST